MSEVENVVARFCDAWNRHDAAALAQLWTDDGELIHPWGYRAVGRAAIRELLEREHASSMAASTLRLATNVTRSDERTALVDLTGVLEGVLAPNGRPYSLPHAISAMFVAQGGQWQIRTMTPVANPR